MSEEPQIKQPVPPPDDAIVSSDAIPKSSVRSVAKIDMLRRMTDAEHMQMTTALETQSDRIQDIFDAAVNFTTDAPEWPLLYGMAVQLYGQARADALLASSD